MKRRRGISEIISSILVISVVVAGLGIYVGLSEQRILGDTITVKDAMEQKNNQMSELVESINMFKNATESNIFQVYLHNYGLKNVTISQVYVNGTFDMSLISNSVYVRDLNKNIISPNNQTIPIGQTSELILNFTLHTSTPNDITNIVIKTDTNKIIQILNGS
jgi:hypothetical protein